MLEKLSQKDATWRNIAFKICGCKSKADDLVQDMYMRRLENDRGQDISTRYIYQTLMSIFLNEKKTNKLILVNDFYNLEQEEDQTTDKRFELLEILKDVSWFEREVLLQTSEKSLRECEKDTGVSYQVFHYTKTKALKKLREKHGRAKK